VKLIFEDHNILTLLKRRDKIRWLIIPLAILFFGLGLLFTCSFAFGLEHRTDIPKLARAIFVCTGIMMLINVPLTVFFAKPIKIYDHGIDLGTFGSVGWTPAILFGVVLYFFPTKVLPWDKIISVHEKFRNYGKSYLLIIDKSDKKYECALADRNSYNAIKDSLRILNKSNLINI